MINLLRRFQQPVLITLTVVVIVAFVILYGGPGTRLDRLGSNSIASIYGRDVKQAEVNAIGRQFQVCQWLGMFDVLIHLSGNARSMQDAMENYVWNTLVLRHQASKLGIFPTDLEVTEYIKALPKFQTAGAYDHGRYTMALQGVLSPNGMNALHLEEIVRDALRLNAIRSTLSASFSPAPDELRETYAAQFQKLQVQLIRIHKDAVANTVTITDEEIKTAFESRKETLKTPEKRKVEYVFFAFPKPEKEGERPSPDVMKDLGDKAGNFAEALTKLDKPTDDLSANKAAFAEIAKKHTVETKTSEFFSEGEAPEEFSKQSRISLTAFKLTKADPFSDTVTTPLGYYVLRLAEIQEPRPKTLEESKADLAESLKTDRTRELLALKASEARKKIEDLKKAGTDFLKAAEEAGFKPEAPEPFSRSESTLKGADSSLIQNRAFELQEGQISAPIEGIESTLLIYLSKKIPFEAQDIDAQKSKMTPMLETARVDGLLSEWIDRQRTAAGLRQRAGMR
jgi:peptidyl-prolyl cis-trans isomerase D